MLLERGEDPLADIDTLQVQLGLHFAVGPVDCACQIIDNRDGDVPDWFERDALDGEFDE